MRALFAIFLLFVLMLISACVSPQEEALIHKRSVTRWAGYTETPRTKLEASWGQACAKIQCTQPTRYPPVQP